MLISENILKQTEDRVTFDIEERKKSYSSKSSAQLEPQLIDIRKKAIRSNTIEPELDALERFIGNNDLVHINYLEMGLRASKAVGRIMLTNPDTGKHEAATGIFISEELLLTNHHVFPESRFAEQARFEMDFEFDHKGEEKERTVFKLEPSKFYHSNKALDYAIVGVEKRDVKGKQETKEFGYFRLDPKVGKAALGEFVTVIQHPDGQAKQIAIRENKILDKEPSNTFLLYEADTSRGSSGGAVCNDQWQLIALHHSGVARKDAKGNYIDKNNTIIAKPGEPVDITRVDWIANEGVRVSAIVADLKKSKVATHEYLQTIISLSPDPSNQSQEKNTITINEHKLNTINTTTTMNDPNPNSQHAVSLTLPLQITISLGGNMPTIHPTVSTVISEEALYEKTEMDLEYDNRKGYDEDFLEHSVPFPKPSAKNLKIVSRLLENHDDYILKYYRHSIVNHGLRKMPICAAVNIDGKKRVSYSRAEGGPDKWYRDRRISLDDQLTNAYYKGSGFDRGHMVRREDTVWGSNVEQAKKGSDDTFRFTNCCPQMNTLNQSGKDGLWGLLEKFVLEEGARDDERGWKISVFNGPIFSESDPYFRGVQVPMRFYKVVAWVDEQGKLKATGFKLSQEKLVGEIEFEEFSFSDEFTNYQYKISALGKLVGLDFGVLEKADTFKGKNKDFQKIDSLEKIEL
jgi:endonuclease G